MCVEKYIVKNNNMRLTTMTESKISMNQYFVGFNAFVVLWLCGYKNKGLNF